MGRELRLSRPAFASSSRQGAAVERACTVKREATVAGLASEGLVLVSGSAGAGSSAVAVPTLSVIYIHIYIYIFFKSIALERAGVIKVYCCVQYVKSPRK